MGNIFFYSGPLFFMMTKPARCCKLMKNIQAWAVRKKGVVINADKSVDIYFGPKAPAGRESNWVQTWKPDEITEMK